MFEVYNFSAFKFGNITMAANSSGMDEQILFIIFNIITEINSIFKHCFHFWSAADAIADDRTASLGDDFSKVISQVNGEVIASGSASIAAALPAMSFRKHFEINLINEWKADYVHYDEIG